MSEIDADVVDVDVDDVVEATTTTTTTTEEEEEEELLSLSQYIHAELCQLQNDPTVLCSSGKNGGGGGKNGG
eukprot:CAMPEP_0119016496 /NCGR_PEP_ID=MMETSP1176-20130426/13298_1 /TAXON_ID=265551 /ORGANISM="Synedropsis recta cf, Strain CCMP1620" /LENGTH=71 /DNA_ID=CAMNT_0006969937 /DNA_START=39 /DNA_END=250 /DNA_ORIENTATION=+